MNKWIIIGSDAPHALERFYLSGLQKMGVDAELIPVRQWWLNKRRSTLGKIYSKLLPSSFCASINSKVVEVVEKKSPDIILIFKGMELSPTTIRRLSRTAFLVMYNPDHPFIYSGVGSGNQWMRDSMKYYDLYISYAQEIVDELRKKEVRSERLPFGYALTDDDYMEVCEEAEVKKVCFLGNGDDHRAGFLNRLSELDVPVVVHGDQWKDRLSDEIEKYPGAYGLDFWKVMRRYRVQLNIMRPHNVASHNMRSFDIPSVGGIGLMPDTIEHREFFPENEVVLYRSIEEAGEQAKRLLNLENDLAGTIRKEARLRCVRAGYSYSQRASQLHDLMKTHFN